MALEIRSGKLDFHSPANTFFKSFTETISALPNLSKGRCDLAIDKETRTVIIKEYGQLGRYKSVVSTITVKAKEDGVGGQVLWTIKCQRMPSPDMDDPQIIETLFNLVKKITNQHP